MRFRIKRIKDIGYFAQVNHRLCWYKIGHTSDGGFCLLPSNDCAYPCKILDYAENKCKLYKSWYNKINAKPEYFIVH